MTPHGQLLPNNIRNLRSIGMDLEVLTNIEREQTAEILFGLGVKT